MDPKGLDDVLQFGTDLDHLDTQEVLDQIAQQDANLKEAVFLAACHAATVDRDLDRREIELLRRMATACDQRFDLSAIKQMTEVWRRIVTSQGTATTSEYGGGWRSAYSARPHSLKKNRAG